MRRVYRGRREVIVSIRMERVDDDDDDVDC